MNYGSADDWELTGSDTWYYELAAANLTNAGIDPANVILAAKYGNYAPDEKAEVAASYGYKYFLQYATEDNDPWYGQEYTLGNPEADYPIEPVSLTVQDSATLLSSYGKKPLSYKINLSTTNYGAKSVSASTGSFMSNYSSMGPTAQLNFKPQLSSPGGNILSTWPLAYGGYTVISGTSMATPYMSAAYAVVKAARPTLTIHQIYALLQSTGTTLNWFYNQKIKSAAIQQGGGLLNIQNALTYQSYITPTSFNLGLQSDWTTWKNTVTVNFTINNLSTRSKTYTLSHVATGLMQNNWWDWDAAGKMYPYYASAKFKTSTITVPAGGSTLVTADISAPVPDEKKWGDDAINLLDPLYSGYIVVTNNNEVYNVPYVGQIWDYCRFDESC